MENLLPMGAQRPSFLLVMLFLALLGVPSEARSCTPPLLHSFPKQAGLTLEEQQQQQYPTGSSLPDCSHACGPCMPCKRVMVSYGCTTTESCPVVYRCMCKGKYYHVPSR